MLKPVFHSLPEPLVLEAAECLKALAHPQRLRMLSMLRQESLTVGELAARCRIRSHLASEHLKLLQRCGFLSPRREGRKVYYEIIEPHLFEILSCMEKRFSTPESGNQQGGK